ncbi:uridine diphosphate-N-acetylglucosamine-binding protein YvcK [Patescibacteria group bacterium]
MSESSILTALSALKVVAIGAGTGQARLLSALAGSTLSLTSIVAVTDNGGHSGELRREFGIPQVGDGKANLIATATNKKELIVFSHRHEDGDVRAGVSTGNLMLADLTRKNGIAAAFRIMGERLKCRGLVLPATEESVDIVARLSDGTVITGEWNILQRGNRLPIQQMSLSRDVPAYSGAIMALREADVIFISPGTFHTGVISPLLPKGMVDAINVSKATVIMICNMITQPGLTEGWDVLKHVEELHKYLGRYPDVVIANNQEIPRWILERYHAAGFNVEPVLFHGATSMSHTRWIPHNIVPPEIDGHGGRAGEFMKSLHLLTHCPRGLQEAIQRALT